MAQLLSWKELLLALAILLPGYYAAVGFLFYRIEVRQLFQRKPNLSQPTGESKISSQTNTEERAALPQMPYDLIEDLKLVFEAAVDQKLEKAQVLEAVQIRVRKYPEIKGSTFQSPISNLVEQELQSKMGWSLSNDEITSIWK
jgi:hypothetical protein